MRIRKSASLPDERFNLSSFGSCLTLQRKLDFALSISNLWGVLRISNCRPTQQVIRYRAVTRAARSVRYR